jgi:hypothetical protein
MLKGVLFYAQYNSGISNGSGCGRQMPHQIASETTMALGVWLSPTQIFKKNGMTEA